MSRFNILDSGQLQPPHKCSTCGGFSDRKFLNFDLYVEWYGTVYICNFCFLDAAGAFSLVPSSQFNYALEQINSLKSLIDNLKSENSELRHAVDSLRDFSLPDPSQYDLRPLSENSVENETGPAERSVEREDGDRNSVETSSAAPSGEDGSIEQTDVGGSENIQQSDSIFSDAFNTIGLKF